MNDKEVKQEELSKDELITLANLLSNAQVKVADSTQAVELCNKLQRMVDEK